MPLVGDTPIEKKKKKTKNFVCVLVCLFVLSNIFMNTLIEHPQTLLNKLSVSEYISLRGCYYLSKTLLTDAMYDCCGLSGPILKSEQYYKYQSKQ